MVLPQAKGEERMKERFLSSSAAVLLGLHLLDWVMTDYALAHGAYELNPISKWFIGKEIFDEAKCVGTILILVQYSFTLYAERVDYFTNYMEAYKASCGVMVVVIGIFVCITISNIVALFKMT